MSTVKKISEPAIQRDDNDDLILDMAKHYLPFVILLSGNGCVLQLLHSNNSFWLPDTLYGEPATALFDFRDHGLLEVMLSEARNQESVGPIPLRLSNEMLERDKSQWCAETVVAPVPAGPNGQEPGFTLALRIYREQISFVEAVPVDRSDRNNFRPSDFQAITKKISELGEEHLVSPEAVINALAQMIGYAELPSGERSLDQLFWAFWRLLDNFGEEGFTKRQLAERRLAADAKSQLETEPRAASTDILSLPSEEDQKAEQTSAQSSNQTNKHQTTPHTTQVRDRIARSFMRKTQDSQVLTVAGSDGISEVEAVKAAVYTLSSSIDGKRLPTLDGINKTYDDALEKTHDRIRELKQMIVGERFSFALQPIVHIGSDKLHHFEALMRYDDEPGSKSPWELIQFAEELDMIQELDLAMTLKICSTLTRLAAMGIRMPVAVNLSGRSIQSPAFLRQFFRLLEDASDFQNLLSFELTESSKITDFDSTNRVLKRIRQFGHKVALDDFGAGASGLQYLKLLDVDCVKIDGQYIRSGIHKPENYQFLTSLVGLCKTRGIEVVGECIESEDEAFLLGDLGVDYGQGWHFGKPSPLRESVNWFVDQPLARY